MVRAKVLLGKSTQDYHGFYGSPPYHRHNKEYTMSEVKQLLSEHGFRVEKAFFRNTTSLTGPLSPRSSFLERFLVSLCLIASNIYSSLKELIFINAKKA